nr:MAG TPA: hypothetical protein [Bacteriophage sp.]
MLNPFRAFSFRPAYMISDANRFTALASFILTIL